MEFLETKALIAAMEQDRERLAGIIQDLLPGEREALRSACFRVIHCIDDQPSSEGKGLAAGRGR